MSIDSLLPIEFPTDKPRRIYLCEDSAEGILSAIYDAWTSRYGHSHNYIQIGADSTRSYFYEYIQVKTDIKKAKNISDAIIGKISPYFYRFVTYCLLSYDLARADDIYRLIILGFSKGEAAINCLTLPFVQRVNKIERTVSNERHHYMGFMRFQEMNDGTLFARFRPKNNIISITAPHFADRFPEERLLIADVKRRLVASIEQRAIKYWQLSDTDFEMLNPNNSANEIMLQNLWKCFISSIEIKERRNISLQNNNMPLRYREFMSEYMRS